MLNDSLHDETPVQLSAKDRELARLKAEHEKMKMKYDEWLQGINTEQVGRSGGEGRGEKRQEDVERTGKNGTGRNGKDRIERDETAWERKGRKGKEGSRH